MFYNSTFFLGHEIFWIKQAEIMNAIKVEAINHRPPGAVTSSIDGFADALEMYVKACNKIEHWSGGGESAMRGIADGIKKTHHLYTQTEQEIVNAVEMFSRLVDEF